MFLSLKFWFLRLFGCTGANYGKIGGIQHDGDTCPIHERTKGNA